ncbi:MAG: hypothetical protein AAFX06_06705 [Planctomycetota bacterium]
MSAAVSTANAPDRHDSRASATSNDLQADFAIAFITFIPSALNFVATEWCAAFITRAANKTLKSNAFSDRDVRQDHGQQEDQQRDADDDRDCG